MHIFRKITANRKIVQGALISLLCLPGAGYANASEDMVEVNSEQQSHKVKHGKPLNLSTNPWLFIKHHQRPSMLTKSNKKNQTEYSEALIYLLNTDLLTESLTKYSHKLPLQIPLADGSMATYEFTYTPVLGKQLANKYPDILSFKAVDVSNPSNTGFFGISPHGFHGMFRHNGKTMLVDNIKNDKHSKHAYQVVYADSAVGKQQMRADKFYDSRLQNDEIKSILPSYIIANINKKASLNLKNQSSNTPALLQKRPISGNTKTTYKIAFSTSGEFTKEVGGTKEDAMATIAKLMARLNEIYERDLNINLELVDGNDALIFTDPKTDPFDNNDQDIKKNPGVVRDAGLYNEIDLGHVLNTGQGGLAATGICNEDYKAAAMSGFPAPNSDIFHVSYVAHEIGHQMGAYHTFNGNGGLCAGDAREASTAWEVLSGSTIMSYTGICAGDNLNPINVGSSDFFHVGSIQQIKRYLSDTSCGTRTQSENSTPIANAGKDYIIPSRTPFKLTGNSSDTDGNELTHIWEQMDTGSIANYSTLPADDGYRPLFRSWQPSAVKVRYLPRIKDVMNDTLAKGENYATTNRNMRFMFTVRDGKGGVSTDKTTITSVENGKRFQVTQPKLGDTWQVGETYTVAWDVADTNNAPINCSQVDISLLDYGNNSFAKKLLLTTDNDGKAEVIAPAASRFIRVMVACSDNIFYQVSSKINLIDSNGNLISAPATDTDTGNINVSNNTSSKKSGGGSISTWLLTLLSLGSLLSIGCQATSGSAKMNDTNNSQGLLLGNASDETKPKFEPKNYSEDNTEIAKDVTQAVNMQDFRLFRSSGKSATLVGFSVEDSNKYTKLCGVRYLPNSSDHIKEPSEFALRDMQYRYAKQYNELMVKFCLTKL